MSVYNFLTSSTGVAMVSCSVTTTSQWVALMPVGGSNRAVTATLTVVGAITGTNTIDVQTSPDGTHVVDLHMDPSSILDHVDTSGDFTSAGAVNITGAAGQRIRVIAKVSTGTDEVGVFLRM